MTAPVVASKVSKVSFSGSPTTIDVPEIATADPKSPLPCGFANAKTNAPVKALYS